MTPEELCVIVFVVGVWVVMAFFVLLLIKGTAEIGEYEGMVI